MSERVVVSTLGVISVCASAFFVWAAPGAAQQTMDYTIMPIVTGRCSDCHTEQGVDRAPAMALLERMTPERIYGALTSGPMAQIAADLDLSDEERRGIAASISGRPMGSVDRSAAGMTNQCTSGALGSVTQGPRWPGWSVDSRNWRYQPDPGLRADQLGDLELKWTFGLPGATGMRGQPTVAGGRVFISSDASMVYSLDARTGCVYWSFDAVGPILNTPVVGPFPGPGERSAVYFGDARSNVYAVDAATGEQLWTVKVGDHPMARISAPGGPALVAEEGLLIVPISGGISDLMASVEGYGCCTFRGSVVLLDARDGRRLWKTHMIPEIAKPTRRNAEGTQMYGPSGASVWVTPTVDLRRRAVYVGTANGYAQMPGENGGDTGATDAIVALDLDTGERRWTRQLQAGDINRVHCGETPEERARNCPLPARTPGVADPLGFATSNDDVPMSPILFTRADGKDLLLVGQESRRMALLDPDNGGAILWQRTLSEQETSTTGNLGPAFDGERAYVSFVYPSQGQFAAEDGAVVAFRPETGEVVWTTEIPAPESCASPGAVCSSGSHGALTAIPGAVFVGALDGTIRALSSETGQVLWAYNTNRDFETANGVLAHGGELGGAAPTVAGGMVYVGSGYFWPGTSPGNVLLAFGVR